MDSLPIIDLSIKQTAVAISRLRQALLKYGAFRLCAPELKQAATGGLLREARGFFQLPIDIKETTQGYSAFGTDLIRGTVPIPKESINFFLKPEQQQEGRIPPPAEFFRSVTALHDKWKQSRDELLSTLFCDVLESEIPLTGTPVLDHESVRIQYYHSQRMIVDGGDYCPPHMDSGILAILIREDDDGDGLEVADLESTTKLSSDGIGREASFLRVPAVPNEMVVLVGTRLQRLLGRSKARACVHRVVGPGQKSSAEDRVSVGIFRGSSLSA